VTGGYLDERSNGTDIDQALGGTAVLGHNQVVEEVEVDCQTSDLAAGAGDSLDDDTNFTVLADLEDESYVPTYINNVLRRFDGA
jgi:hypothetical protein